MKATSNFIITIENIFVVIVVVIIIIVIIIILFSTAGYEIGNQ